ncbi:MAG: VOC family protein [Myxococcales bacterium]|jgi:predicted enzyme related to lactoylglutathione lyase|nr:VOC family protein [Myxococcales bacterium]
MGNPFVHIELSTGDVAKASKFYKSLFQWKYTQQMGGEYTMVDVGTGTGGGMMKSPPGAPTMWLPYVEVDDVKATIAKAKKLGANVVVEFMPIGEMGAIGVFIDPTGAALGVWAPTKKAAPAKKAAAKKAAPAKKAAAKKAAKPAKKKSGKKG